MLFGNESSSDKQTSIFTKIGSTRSPMPFGNESSSDIKKSGSIRSLIKEVTNAFRQRVLFGHLYVSIQHVLKKHTSPMPFGNESSSDLLMKKYKLTIAASHQCLSATSPLRTCLQFLARVPSTRSPMPFGNESSSDTSVQC